LTGLVASNTLISLTVALVVKLPGHIEDNLKKYYWGYLCFVTLYPASISFFQIFYLLLVSLFSIVIVFDFSLNGSLGISFLWRPTTNRKLLCSHSRSSAFFYVPFAGIFRFAGSITSPLPPSSLPLPPPSPSLLPPPPSPPTFSLSHLTLNI
jgi:hypothetical protein